MKNIEIEKCIVWIRSGCFYIGKVKATIFVKDSLDEGDTSLGAFIIIDNKEFPVRYGDRYFVDKSGMTKDDWIKYNWDSLVK